MNDKRTFIDSNIILYLFTNNEKRKRFVSTLMTPQNLISTQIVNENVNVCLKKLKIGKDEAYNHGKNLLNTFNVVSIYPSTITDAFSLSIKYGFSFWDSLVVSAALENNCEILLTEDMHNGLLVNEKLRIKNPFEDI
jgi:predicted nucleic acid-binding protein